MQRIISCEYRVDVCMVHIVNTYGPMRGGGRDDESDRILRSL